MKAPVIIGAHPLREGWFDLAMGSPTKAHWFSSLCVVPHPDHGSRLVNDFAFGAASCGKFFEGFIPRFASKARCKTCARSAQALEKGMDG